MSVSALRSEGFLHESSEQLDCVQQLVESTSRNGC